MFNKTRKYRNQPTEINGIRFDSKKEGNRYLELLLLAKNGIIRDLKLQPKFQICGSVKRDPATGRKMAARYYQADFLYFDIENNKIVVEDVKSPATAKDKLYRLKRHLFLSQYGDQFSFMEI